MDNFPVATRARSFRPRLGPPKKCPAQNTIFHYYIALKKKRSSDNVWLVGSRLVGVLSEILSESCRMACRESLSEIGFDPPPLGRGLVGPYVGRLSDSCRTALHPHWALWPLSASCRRPCLTALSDFLAAGHLLEGCLVRKSCRSGVSRRKSCRVLSDGYFCLGFFSVKHSRRRSPFHETLLGASPRADLRKSLHSMGLRTSL